MEDNTEREPAKKEDLVRSKLFTGDPVRPKHLLCSPLQLTLGNWALSFLFLGRGLPLKPREHWKQQHLHLRSGEGVFE